MVKKIFASLCLHVFALNFPTNESFEEHARLDNINMKEPY